jgi:hypothetical protein
MVDNLLYSKYNTPNKQAMKKCKRMQDVFVCVQSQLKIGT